MHKVRRYSPKLAALITPTVMLAATSETTSCTFDAQACAECALATQAPQAVEPVLNSTIQPTIASEAATPTLEPTLEPSLPPAIVQAPILENPVAGAEVAAIGGTSYATLADAVAAAQAGETITLLSNIASQ